MNFTNDQIGIDQLPKIEGAQLHPLEPSYLTIQKISIAIASFIVIVIFSIFFFFIAGAKNNLWLYIIFALAILILILIYLGNNISFPKKGYAIREKDVIYRSGWLVEKVRIIPLNRVQHVSVQSGPLERKFKLGSVSLFTAGSINADFSIKGLKETTAHQIKEWITSQLYDNTQNG